MGGGGALAALKPTIAVSHQPLPLSTHDVAYEPVDVTILYACATIASELDAMMAGVNPLLGAASATGSSATEASTSSYAPVVAIVPVATVVAVPLLVIATSVLASPLHSLTAATTFCVYAKLSVIF